jgi:myo-inositol 2-dehydrogenase / D-chiro-inositol 1-dehydrogenase
MTFKICLIGCGALVNSHHGPAYVHYARTHSETELTACCDILPQKAEAFAHRFGFQRWYSDSLLMLESERPHAVCLVVPPSETCALTCQVLELGIPLILEKPPGLTTLEIDRMITAARLSGAPNQVAFNRRYTPLVAALKQWLAEDPPPAGLQHLQYDFFRIGRTDPDFSTTAIHGIDAVRFLAGSDYARVNFHYHEFPELGPTTANILLECTFASGATAQLSFLPISGAVIERATLHYHDCIYFLQLPIWNAFDAPGSLVEVVQGKVTRSLSGLESVRSLDRPSARSLDGMVSGSAEDFILNGFYDEDAVFFDDIRSGCTPQGDLESARQSVEIAQCIRERRASYPIPSAPSPS